MTVDFEGPDEEEITVRMPAGWIDRLDEIRFRRGYVSRGRVVAEAIQQAADG